MRKKKQTASKVDTLSVRQQKLRLDTSLTRPLVTSHRARRRSKPRLMVFSHGAEPLTRQKSELCEECERRADAEHFQQQWGKTSHCEQIWGFGRSSAWMTARSEGYSAINNSHKLSRPSEWTLLAACGKRQRKCSLNWPAFSRNEPPTGPTADRLACKNTKRERQK